MVSDFKHPLTDIIPTRPNPEEHNDGDEENRPAPSRGKGKAREKKFGDGRVWVGREGGDEGTGSWIGVWEFRGDVGECFRFVRTVRGVAS